MAQIKKILAGALALCMAGSVLTACGGDKEGDTGSTGGSESKTEDAKGGSEGGNEEKKEDTKEETKPADTASLVNTGKVYNVYCWNTEFKERFEKYYEGAKDTALWDGVTINWVINPNEGNNYQTKLDEAIKKQSSAADDEKVDLFLVEADYAMKYVNSDACLDVIGEIGITKDDLKDQYKYTQDVMTDSNGTLKGLSWQATPGLFLYNAEYAKEVLGTDDPDEVQAQISDWTKFGEVAQKMKDKGIFMVSGYDDTYRCFSNNVSGPWVTDGKITIDPQIKAWADQTKEYSDKGYNNGTSLWDPAWTAGQKIDGKVFGYFFSTWGIPFTLLPNTLDKSADEGGEMAEGNGGYGKWRACKGPQSYFWGGTWIVGCFGSDNVAITRDVMLKLTCDADIMAQITENEQDYTNNKAAIKKLIDGGYTNPFLGGQNHLVLLSDAAEQIDLTGKVSAYDQGCNEEFQGAMKDYFQGTVTYDEALAKFKTNITTKYGDLTMD
ncbi:MAG: carbohydrate ABC transporter substrate-binding protein [Ruminococcus sp.]|nr:carbohydrate ABC transporter substrate-binding protein [Ruminococcus sp.]